MAKLWGGRFEQESSKLLEDFNASIGFDWQMWREDIQGSIAHARMLHKIGILSESELDSIITGLGQIAREIESGNFVLKNSDEDIHMAIESALSALIGDAGKKLHTARSRNDQVALDFKLFILRANKTLRLKLLSLMQTLLHLSESHTQTLMPGMTHLQHAQPVSLGFHLVAWCCNFMRDILRLESSFKRNNFSPLGSGAIAGTPYNNDRGFVARELGFYAPSLNAMDSVSERDFALDMLYDIAMLMMHISRISEELILWSSTEFGFVTLSDAYSTGSSIMPQKKNPDVPELLRGKSGRAFGNLQSLLVVMKGLPLAYNKDTQEDKEAVFDSIKTANISIEILEQCLATLTFHTQNMLKMAESGHLSATDLADFLVRDCNIPFRDAHHITGRVVAYAQKLGKDISELTQEELKSIDSQIADGAIKVLDLYASMQARNSLGGTASSQVTRQIQELKDFVVTAKRDLEQ
ncbi:argininosuccinate lyase [Helicobacter sp. 10-6591]|uniref:argininosuccinate lyase n=1 Tax=Helicobacter sp. 10-6591 TaxID=2004998 RepID=UPI000DCC1A24|nr:argininosuccinate lyase [Helicobacter sp. 10-6591]RAX53923.1 argininosuccinate lyase [Helicobacter sp. 10-6591]